MAGWAGGAGAAPVGGDGAWAAPGGRPARGGLGGSGGGSEPKTGMACEMSAPQSPPEGDSKNGGACLGAFRSGADGEGGLCATRLRRLAAAWDTMRRPRLGSPLALS